jgi:hypothetical protein
MPCIIESTDHDLFLLLDLRIAYAIALIKSRLLSRSICLVKNYLQSFSQATIYLFFTQNFATIYANNTFSSVAV